MSTEPKVAGFSVGSKAEVEHLITAEDIRRFVEITGDDNPLHVDRDFAEKTSFKGIVAHGMLSASFISTIIGKHIPGSGALWMSQSLEFLLPVRIGDKLRILAEVTGVQASQRILVLRTEIWNQNDQLVLAGESKVKVLEVEPCDAPSTGKKRVQVAIVTGASRGIGAETAKRLAEDGFAVVVNYRRDEEGAKRVVAEIEKAGGSAAAVRADICRAEDVRELVAVAVAKFGGLSTIVNNASGALVYKPFASVTAADISCHMETLFFGAFCLVQEALPHLEKAENAAVVSVGSIIADSVPAMQLMPYAAAKAALASMSKSLAIEYGPKDIRFNVVSPGMTDTRLIADVPEKAKMLARMQTPLRRLATPADIAESIAFLASPRAGHITGETLRVCGGTVMI